MPETFTVNVKCPRTPWIIYPHPISRASASNKTLYHAHGCGHMTSCTECARCMIALSRMFENGYIPPANSSVVPDLSLLE